MSEFHQEKYLWSLSIKLWGISCSLSSSTLSRKILINGFRARRWTRKEYIVRHVFPAHDDWRITVCAWLFWHRCLRTWIRKWLRRALGICRSALQQGIGVDVRHLRRLEQFEFEPWCTTWQQPFALRFASYLDMWPEVKSHPVHKKTNIQYMFFKSSLCLCHSHFMTLVSLI